MAEPRLINAVREILLNQWNPLGVLDHPENHDEYDGYAQTVCRFLGDGVDEFRLEAYLTQIQTVSMGLSRVDQIRDKLVVRRLSALRATLL